MGARDILTFPGKRFDGRFKGEQINLCKKRFPGARVKHWMKRNRISGGLRLMLENKPDRF
jgi:hypothetical protein